MPMPNVQSSGIDITQLLGTLDKMFGGGKTTSTSETTPSGAALGQSDALLKKIFADVNPGDIDAMIGNILTRAKQEFGPAAIASNASGARAYSDTVLASSRNEAMARATGEAAKAKLDALNAANRTAAGLVEARLQSSKMTVAKTKAGPSTLGTALALGTGGAWLWKKMGKPKSYDDAVDTAKDFLGMNQYGPDLSGSRYADELVADFNSGYAASSEAGVSLDAFGPLSGASATAQLEGGGGNDILDASTTSSAPATTDVISSAPAVTVDPNTGAIISISDPAAMKATLTGTQNPSFSPVPNEVDPITGLMAPSQVPAATQAPVYYPDIPIDPALSEAGADAAAAGDVGSAASSGVPVLAAITIADALSGGQISEARGELSGSDYAFVGDQMALTDKAISEATGIEELNDPVTNAITSALTGDSCFVTTAATQNGELDNGFTLSALRDFRNTYMQETPERKSELVDYYLLAPFIVKRINESPVADNIYATLRQRFLIPAVNSYLFGNSEKTHEIYKAMLYWARQQVGLATPEMEG
jgi:hypothetical protein